MFGSWKLYAALGLAIVIGALAWAADHYHSKAKIEAMRADRAEKELAEANAIIAFKDAQTKVLNAVIAKKDAADKKTAKQIDTLQKELAHDPQANDPAPRVIRRALGKLPE